MRIDGREGHRGLTRSRTVKKLLPLTFVLVPLATVLSAYLITP